MSTEQDSFGHRLRGAYPRVLAFFWKRRPDLAEDLAQDVTLAAWRARDEFRGEARLDTYLFRICLRIEARTNKRTSGVFAMTEVTVPPDTTEDEADSLARACVEGAFATLDGDLREVLELAYSEGLSRTEIAERAGIPAGTVASRLRRAQAQLRDAVVSPRGGAAPGMACPDPKSGEHT